jgi:hypothetical protein
MALNFKQIIDALKSQTLWNKVGLAGIRIIRKRTREGTDVEGKSFQEYSEGYAKKRERAGLPTHPVNLQFDDIQGMLMMVDHEVFNTLDGVKIFINDSAKEQLAVYHNIEGAGKGKVIRRFWGFNEFENEQLSDLAEKEVANILKKLN